MFDPRELLASLAPSAPTLEPGIKSARRSLLLASEVAVAIAGLEPYGAHLVAWTKYAGGSDSEAALVRELLLEASRWPESMAPAKCQQLRQILAAALDEWLHPPRCRCCRGRGMRHKKDGNALIEMVCDACAGQGTRRMSRSARASKAGVPWTTWANDGGRREAVYNAALDALDRWDRDLLRHVWRRWRAREEPREEAAHAASA